MLLRSSPILQLLLRNLLPLSQLAPHVLHTVLQTEELGTEILVAVEEGVLLQLLLLTSRRQETAQRQTAIEAERQLHRLTRQRILALEVADRLSVLRNEDLTLLSQPTPTEEPTTSAASKSIVKVFSVGTPISSCFLSATNSSLWNLPSFHRMNCTFSSLGAAIFIRMIASASTPGSECVISERMPPFALNSRPSV